jgi:hypothetical protein
MKICALGVSASQRSGIALTWGAIIAELEI